MTLEYIKKVMHGGRQIKGQFHATSVCPENSYQLTVSVA